MLGDAWKEPGVDGRRKADGEEWCGRCGWGYQLCRGLAGSCQAGAKVEVHRHNAGLRTKFIATALINRG